MGKTILVADDSRTIRRAVELTFRATSFQVVGVESAEQALASIQEVRPDVVLADASMPGTDGYGLCDAIKTNATTARIPVLLLSSKFDPFDQTRGEQARADGHIDKPWDTQSLINAIKELTGMPVDGAEPQSFAAALAQRQQAEAQPANGQPAPATPFGAPAQERAPEPAPPPPPSTPPVAAAPAMARPAASPAAGLDDVVIEEPEEVQAGPSLEPPRPPAAGARPPVDMWALDDPNAPDAGPPPGADDAIEEIAIEDVPMDEAEPVTMEGVPGAVADAAASAVARSAGAVAPGLPQEQLVAVAREVIERIAWEVVPDLAESIIRAELKRLLED